MFMLTQIRLGNGIWQDTRPTGYCSNQQCQTIKGNLLETPELIELLQCIICVTNFDISVNHILSVIKILKLYFMSFILCFVSLLQE